MCMYLFHVRISICIIFTLCTKWVCINQPFSGTSISPRFIALDFIFNKPFLCVFLPFLLLHSHSHILCASLPVYEYSICREIFWISAEINVCAVCDLMTLLSVHTLRQAGYVGMSTRLQGIGKLCSTVWLHLFVCCTFAQILMQQLQYCGQHDDVGQWWRPPSRKIRVNMRENANWFALWKCCYHMHRCICRFVRYFSRVIKRLILERQRITLMHILTTSCKRVERIRLTDTLLDKCDVLGTIKRSTTCFVYIFVSTV